MIYFVTCQRANAVKIGYIAGRQFTGYVHKRVSMLQVGCPLRLELAAVQMDGGVADERELHARFAEHHIHGEWFTLAAEIARHMETLEKPHAQVRTPRGEKLARKWSTPEPEVAA